MSGRNIIDNLRYFEKFNEMKDDLYIKYKIAGELIKFIPNWNEPPTEMKSFIKKMKAKGFDNADTIKDVVFKLAEAGKILITTNKNNETYFQKVMIMPKS